MNSPTSRNVLRLIVFLLLGTLCSSCLKNSEDSGAKHSDSVVDSLQKNAPPLPHSPNSTDLTLDDSQPNPANLFEAWMAIPDRFLKNPFFRFPISPTQRKMLWKRGQAAPQGIQLEVQDQDTFNSYFRFQQAGKGHTVETVICFKKIYDTQMGTEENPFPISERRILIAHNYIGDFTATLGMHVLSSHNGRWQDRRTEVMPLVDAWLFDNIPWHSEYSKDLSAYLEAHGIPPTDPETPFLRWQLPRTGHNVLVAPGKIHQSEGLPKSLDPFVKTTAKKVMYERRGLYSPKSSRLGDAFLDIPLEYLSVEENGKMRPVIPPEMDSPATRVRLLRRNAEMVGVLQMENGSDKLILSTFSLAPYDLILITGHAQGQALVHRCIAKRGREYKEETAMRFPPIDLDAVKEACRLFGIDPSYADLAKLQLLPEPIHEKVELRIRSEGAEQERLINYHWNGERFESKP